MIKPIAIKLLLLFLIIPTINWAQTITGQVVDEEKRPLEFVAVTVINPLDSTLVSYSSTDKYGDFELVDISDGENIFQIHLIGYNTHQKTINFQNKDIKMGIIRLIETVNILDEVVVNFINPISIKKDTVSYNTKAFKVRAEDTVEDLLKKLPGVEVDAMGKITAQGEDITKILVDGKEFFSGDPAIAMKNLSADAIKKVEIIDESSEEAKVTGIGDSEKNKIINLTLKDDKKVNDFGKFQGGYGTDDRYLTSLNYNRFSPKVQMSIIGKFNNINSSGSDISEILSFGGSSRSSTGFLTTGAAGFNFGYEFKKDQNLNADYFFNHTDYTSGEVDVHKTELINPESNFKIITDSNSKNEKESNGNTLNFSFIDRSNKLSTFNIYGKLSNNKTNSNSIRSEDLYNQYDTATPELDLHSESNSSSEGKNASGNVRLKYVKRFNKESKRNISMYAQLSGANSDNTTNSYQLDRYDLSNPGNEYTIITEGIKNKDVNTANLEFGLKYTEPLKDAHYLEVRVDVETDKIDESVDQSQIENDIVQTPLIYDQYYKNTNLSGALFYKYDKNDMVISGGVTVLNQNQNFGLDGTIEKYDNTYTNVNPSVYFRYRPKKGKFIFVHLSKRVNLPLLHQLTPVISDFDPRNITKGNPFLTPEDRYSVSGRYSNFNFATRFRFYTSLKYNYTQNTIIQSRTRVDQTTTSTYQNEGDKNNLSLRFGFGKTVKSFKLRYNIKLGVDYSDYFTIINDEINQTNQKSGTLGFSIENDKKNKIDASLGANFSKNFTYYSSSNVDYFQQSYFVKSDWNMTDKWNLNSQFKYDLYTDSTSDLNQSVPIWNASLSYAFFKGNSMNIKLSALDILNKNIGIIRNGEENIYTETRREVLGTYYMLSLTYALNGNKNAKAKPNRGGRRHHRSFH